MGDNRLTISDKHNINFKDLPFNPNFYQIFFYDPNPDSELSKEIEENYKEIKERFNEIGFDFYCFNKISKSFSEDFVKYRFPNWGGEPLKKIGNDLLKQYLVEEDRDIGASLIRYYGRQDYEYSCFQFHDLKDYSLIEQIEFYISKLDRDSGIRFSISIGDDDERERVFYEKKYGTADYNFDVEAKKIAKKIQELVETLHQDNVGEFVLRCMVSVEEKLSRLVITPKYEILLPDYSSEPVDMSPLPKALFLLFLKHEEGFYFKELVDYNKELKEIYTKITNRVSSLVIGASIDKITDPTQNAINEKCSRIREAFLKKIDERIAKQYYITGCRGEKKKITLPRDLVEWQCDL